MDRIEAIEPPPNTITPTILACIEKIGEAIGRAQATGAARDLTLSRINRIRTIRGSLAIEGNTLSEEQVATILDGEPVAGPYAICRKFATPSLPTIFIQNGTRRMSATSWRRTRF